MSIVHVEVSEVINATPAKVYAVLSDYRIAHPAVLPKPYFQELVVEEGGVGEGTVFRLRMKTLGVENRYRMTVTEPEPGRVLMEADEDAGVVTTFTVDPVGDGAQTRLTIATDTRLNPGIKGFIEKLFAPMMARRIYRKELSNISDYLRNAKPEGELN